MSYKLPSCHRIHQVKTMLVCGADVLESFIKPGVWVEEQVRRILGDHGVVCIARYINSSYGNLWLAVLACFASKIAYKICYLGLAFGFAGNCLVVR